MNIPATRIFCTLALAVCTASAQDQPPREAPPRPPGSGGIRQPPPPLPKYPDVRQPGETGFYLGLTVWFPVQHPTINKGRAATFTDQSKTALQGRPKYAQGAEMGFALGLHNALKLSYFEDKASGNFTNTTPLRLWNQSYPANNLVSTSYRVQNAKISFDYLTWPYPAQASRFRFKTLWGIQYTGVRTGFDLPLLPIVDASGNPLPDAQGNQLTYGTKGSHWFISPAIGVGVADYVSRRLRLEANASGFTIPHHTTVWDADASANFRAGHLELRVGVKAFHFKTSTQAEFYMKGTQASAFAGVRWYSN